MNQSNPCQLDETPLFDPFIHYNQLHTSCFTAHIVTSLVGKAQVFQMPLAMALFSS